VFSRAIFVMSIFVTSLLLTPLSLRLPPLRCCAEDFVPPALKGAEQFARGAIGRGSWWRQDPQRLQIVVALPEGASFSRDVSVELSRKRIQLAVAGTTVLDGSLAHEAVSTESEWFVEEEPDGFERARYLVMDIKKSESFLDWAAPLEGAAAVRRVLIGGKGPVQKQATAQQLASYQVLQKLPSAQRGDVYVHASPGAGGMPSDLFYFVGKVISEVASAPASLATQAVLVRQHARLYLPDVFGAVENDDAIELWLAPGNTEMKVAQNMLPLVRWVPPESAQLPSAGECGFEPETKPPPHMGTNVGPFAVKRDANGQPLSAAFEAKVVKPDEVPGTYEKWLEKQ